MNVSPGDRGSVKVDGSAPRSYPAIYEFEVIREVTIEAVPASGYEFDHWSGCVTGSINPISVKVDSTKEMTAHFSPRSNPEPMACMGDYLWEDRGRDGIQEASGPGKF